jgi:hypothetical protein
VSTLACVAAAALIAGCKNDDAGGGGPQAGAGGMLPVSGAGAGAGGLPGAGGAATELGVPCNVAMVISANCTLCHTDPPSFGALMPLMRFADFHAASRSMPERKVYEVMPARINATEIRMRMPPASSSALQPADLQTLNTWLQGGAQGVTTGACAITAMR